MCGIIGIVGDKPVSGRLIESLRRLEYRGYDSAGLAVLNGSQHLTRLRTVGKVRMLDEALKSCDRSVAVSRYVPREEER